MPAKLTVTSRAVDGSVLYVRPLTATMILPALTPAGSRQWKVTTRRLRHSVEAFVTGAEEPPAEEVEGEEVDGDEGAWGVTGATLLGAPAPDPFTARTSTW
jgi:hypothetical protein